MDYKTDFVRLGHIYDMTGKPLYAACIKACSIQWWPYQIFPNGFVKSNTFLQKNLQSTRFYPQFLRIVH